MVIKLVLLSQNTKQKNNLEVALPAKRDTTIKMDEVRVLIDIN